MFEAGGINYYAGLVYREYLHVLTRSWPWFRGVLGAVCSIALQQQLSPRELPWRLRVILYFI
jgi:hypothetical protein